MFVFSLTYVKPLSEVERVLPDHVRFLDRYYDLGKFVCSGRKNPRTGGVILCAATDATEAEAIMREAPFFIEGIARYEVIEFQPSKYAEAFRAFVS